MGTDGPRQRVGRIVQAGRGQHLRGGPAPQREQPGDGGRLLRGHLRSHPSLDGGRGRRLAVQRRDDARQRRRLHQGRRDPQPGRARDGD